MIRIHADAITVNCRKVLAGLDYLGAPFELVHVDYFKGEQKLEPYVSLNPNAALPSLVDGDFVLWESNAILTYVADKLGRHDAYPTDLRARADLHRWLLWESSSWFPVCYAFLVENCVKPLLGGQPDAGVLESSAVSFHKLASILDHRLRDRRWIMGDTLTLADIALAAPMHLHGWQQLPLEGHPTLRRWMLDGVEKLPSWEKTWVGEGFVTKR